MITQVFGFIVTFLYTIVQIVAENTSIRLHKTGKTLTTDQPESPSENVSVAKDEIYQFVTVFGGSHNEYGRALCQKFAKKPHIFVINIDSPNGYFSRLPVSKYLQIDCTDFAKFELLEECIDKMENVICATKRSMYPSTILVLNNIDIGVDNIGGNRGILEEKFSIFMHTTTCNATNVMLIFKEIIQRFQENHCLYLINISNVVGLYPRNYKDHSYAYSCSKAAVIQLHQSLTYEENKTKKTSSKGIKTLLIILPFSSREPSIWKRLFMISNKNKNNRFRKQVNESIHALNNGRRGELYLADEFAENLKVHAKYKFKQFNEINSF